jgi:hypothetical protein
MSNEDLSAGISKLEPVTYEVLKPQGTIQSSTLSGLKNPRISDFTGRKIALLWDGKPGGDIFLNVLKELLSAKYPQTNFFFSLWGDPQAPEIIVEVDAFVLGVGDSASGATYGMRKMLDVEKRGKPGVFLLVDTALSPAKLLAEAEGMPAIRIMPVPSDEYFKSRINAETIRPVVEKYFNDIVRALIGPLTSEESNPQPQSAAEKNPTVTIAGANYSASLRHFNKLFLDQRWGDGLPLVPPTREAVQEMLKGTKRSPAEVVGKIPPLNGVATIEKIAINSVMAGANPEYLPVIVAAMEGLTNREDPFQHMMVSAGSFNLMIMISGPIAKSLNINSGIGLLGHGWQANSTIGRAVRLCLINIGHIWPAEIDMALLGRPSAHTFYTFAENEENSPWEPYHVGLGFAPEDSCVTVSTVGSFNGGINIYGGGSNDPWTTRSILQKIIDDISKDRVIFASYKPGLGLASSHPRKHIVVLNPELANALHQEGFSRQSLRDYLIDTTSVSYEKLSPEEIDTIHRRMETKFDAFMPINIIPPDRIKVFENGLKPGSKVPVVIRPEDISIVVAGGIPGYSFGMSYLRNSHQTRLIRL